MSAPNERAAACFKETTSEPDARVVAMPPDVWRACAWAPLLAAIVIALLPPTADAQSSAPGSAIAKDLQFDVVSVRRNLSGDPARGRINAGRFTATSTPILQLIQQGYGRIARHRIANLPEWVASERYDITATVPEGVQIGTAIGPLVQALLRDRFNFQAHHETREMPIYELVIARPNGELGLGMQRAECDCAGDRSKVACRQAPALPTGTGQTPAGPAPGACAQMGDMGHLIIRGYPVSAFALMLEGVVERTAVDQTRLSGSWNVDVTFAPASVTGQQPGPQSTDAPSIFTALQEQLGLRLRPGRGRVDVLVIDSISRPQEN